MGFPAPRLASRVKRLGAEALGSGPASGLGVLDGVLGQVLKAVTFHVPAWLLWLSWHDCLNSTWTELKIESALGFAC